MSISFAKHSKNFVYILSCIFVSVLFLFFQGLNQLTAEQQEEVHRVCDIIPDVEVKVRTHP